MYYVNTGMIQMFKSYYYYWQIGSGSVWGKKSFFSFLKKNAI